MNFVESVKSVLFENYAKFKGRAPRAEFWYYVLFTILLGISLVVLFFLFIFSVGEGFNPDYVEKLLNPDRCANVANPVACVEQGNRLFLTHIIEETNAANYLVISLVVSVVLFLPSFSVVVRRSQDLDRSFYYALPFLVNSIFNLYLSVLLALDPVPTFIWLADNSQIETLSGISTIVTIIYALWFLQPGQYDPNRFGPNKLEEKDVDTY